MKVKETLVQVASVLWISLLRVANENVIKSRITKVPHEVE